MAAGDPGSPARYYSSTAVETSLQSSIAAQSQGASNTSFIVASISGFPGDFPYTLIVDPDTSKEEVVTVTAGSSTTLTVTRGSDNTQGVAHSAGAVVRHGVSGREFRESQTHIASRGYDTDSALMGLANQTHVHGLATGDGVVVGTTKSQTLSSKTLTTPTINGATLTGTVTSTATISGGTFTSGTVTSSTISASTFTGSFTASAATFVSPTISGSPVITGLSSVGMSTSSATPKSYVDAILGDAQSAATSAASAAASAVAAATSATSASNSAIASATSASASATSAGAAATSATSASNSASAAATSATSASNSANAASTSATSASNSATAAAASASAAATSATSASNSASAAATSATNAANSATAAATSATSAAASAASAAAVLAGAVSATIFDAKGDLIVASAADTAARLAAATTNGYVLSVNSATATGLEWIANDVGDITAVTSGTGITVTNGTGPVPSVAIDSTVATLTGTQTLSNKTIALGSNTVSGTTAQFNTALTDGDFATIAGTETLTNKTLTSPTVNTATIAGGTIADSVIKGFEEDVNVVASAATGTINFDVSTASVWYYTSNATANHTLNFRYSSGTTLNSALAVGDAITLVWLNTNGSTAYYPNVIQIDGSAVTPRVPAAISAGNASAIDAYVFTIIKTAATPTYTVLETQTKFA